MPAEVHKDKGGSLWRVPEFSPTRFTKYKPIPGLDVWWARSKDFNDETLIIHQDFGEHSDVLTLTLGQVYDLIAALNKAVEGV